MGFMYESEIYVSFSDARHKKTSILLLYVEYPLLTLNDNDLHL